MKSKDIEKFFAHHPALNLNTIQINFKHKKPVQALFLQNSDFTELKKKNFWRVILHDQVEAYQNTGNQSLGKLFRGDDFSKLTEHIQKN